MLRKQRNEMLLAAALGPVYKTVKLMQATMSYVR